MYNKLIALSAAMIILFTGCSLKQTNSKEQDMVIQDEKAQNANAAEKMQDSPIEENTARTTIVSYGVDKEFKQGEATTFVREILLYPENETSEGYTVIQFNLNVKNNTGRDIYMVYDISPLVLNTGEQVDYSSKCDISRIFKNVIKDGTLTYKVKSKIGDIKTLRWILASPLYNGTQLIGQECDYTFVLENYKKGN